MVLAVLIPAAALLAYTVAVYIEAGLGHERAGLQRTAHQVARLVGKDLGDARETMKRIAALPSVQAMDPASCDPAFRVLPPLDPLTDQLGLRTVDGHLVCSFFQHPANVPSGLPWFALGLKRGTFTVGDPWLGRNTKRWVSVLTYPVRNGAGREVGMVILPLDLDELQRRDLSHVPAPDEASVIDSRGRFALRSSGQAAWVGKSAAVGSLSAAQQRAIPGPAEFTDAGGTVLLRAAATVPGTDWVAVVTMPKRALMSAELARAKPVLAAGIPLLLAAMLLAYLLARRISRPIRRIGAAARAVSAGDLDVRIEPRGPSELRAVAVEFNRMLEAKVLVDRETHEHQHWASNLLENASDAVLIVDPEHMVKYASPSIRDLAGHDAHAVVGRSYLDFVHPDDAAGCRADLDGAAAGRGPIELREMRFRRQDGRWATVATIAKNALEDPTLAGIVLSVRDVTRQRDAEQRVRRLNVLYATLSASNSAVIRSHSRAELSANVCKVIDQYGGGIAAWIGFVDPGTQRILPEAWTPSMADVLPRALASMEPAVSREHTPLGIATRTGAAYFCDDVFGDPAFRSWHDLCARYGVRSAAVIPLRVAANGVGAISLYAGQKAFFTPDMQALLKELGDDMSYALEALDRDRQRKEAEAALGENEAKFRGLVEQELTGIYIIQDGRLVYTNPYLARLFGYGAEEMLGIEIRRVIDPADQPLVEENLRRRLAGEIRALQYTFRARRKDGSGFTAGVHGSRSVFNGRPAVIGLLQDITEREKAEQLAKEHLVDLERAMLGTIDAVSAMVELRDPYTAGHERRVGELASAIGRELGLPEHVVEGLRIAGALHDIGKIGCPSEILSKPSRLSPTEFALIKAHPQLGHDILKSVHFPWPIADIALQHHERIDGSGYPRGLHGDQIMLEARILAVADTVEAMASHRPYRPARGIDAALKEVETQSGKSYDPQVVAACLRLFRDKGFAFTS